MAISRGVIAKRSKLLRKQATASAGGTRAAVCGAGGESAGALGGRADPVVSGCTSWDTAGPFHERRKGFTVPIVRRRRAGSQETNTHSLACAAPARPFNRLARNT
ncbi:hypothetical protein GCM10018792_78780 [Streptomyces rubradiris]|nr:hypothetical protein GCM10018792_78780 [Streptomyces rubradiris]